MTGRRGTGSDRLVFANQLRGLAALSVSISHLLGVYWLMRDVVSAYTFAPQQPGPVPAIVGVVSYPWFNFGPFGVGIFFLISGLVVPISLEKHSRLSFLAARALRIYPTYLVALCVETLVLYGSSRWWHEPFAISLHTFVDNALLIYNLTGVPSLDLVNWTLCIELKFYVLLSVFAGSVRAGRVLPLLAIAVAIVGLVAALPASSLADSEICKALATEAMFIVFMFIGVLFNFRLRKRIGPIAFVVCVGAMGLLFVAAWQLGPLAAQYPIVTVNYGYALLLFGALYAVRRFIRETPVLDFMAAISFPFYLIHSLIGYAVMKVLMLSAGVGYLVALAFAFSVDLLLAAALHVTIEQTSIALGRRIAPRSGATTRVAVAAGG
jgi:peptidoglycan/LPS O-acetylase OafA/YrhL